MSIGKSLYACFIIFYEFILIFDNTLLQEFQFSCVVVKIPKTLINENNN